MKKRLFLLPIIAMFGLASCGGGDAGQSSVTLSDVSKTVEVGSTFELTATSTDESDIVWTVESNIVTLSAEQSKSGVAITVTGARVGETKIVAENQAGKAAECAVTVTEAGATVTSIAITTEPTKKIYQIGEQLDLTGMVVEANYSNQTHRTLENSEYTVSGFDSSVANNALPVTVSFSGKSAQFTVRIMPDPASLPNVAVFYAFHTGGEGAVLDHRGYIITLGVDGGTVNNMTLISQGEYGIEYTAGWNWTSIQMFYGLPYVNGGDHVNVKFTLTSSVNGTVTVNNQAFNVQASVAREIVIEDYVVPASAAVISMQLGISSGGEHGQFLPSGTIVISGMEVKDLTNDYATVLFKVGEETRLTEYVKKGSTIFYVPNNPVAPAGQTFVGWVDEQDNHLYKSTIVSVDTVFTAKFMNSGDVTYRTVHVHKGSSAMLYQDIQVIDQLLLEKERILAPTFTFTQKVYDSNTLEHEFDFDTPITADTDIYVLFGVKYDETYNHGVGGAIDPAFFANDADGALHMSGLTCWGAGGQGWYLQVNFSLPRQSLNYHIHFEYKINLPGGNVQCYDNATLDSAALSVAEEYQTVTLNYAGPRAAGSKLTFELGAIQAMGQLQTIELQIRNLYYTYD